MQHAEGTKEKGTENDSANAAGNAPSQSAENPSAAPDWQALAKEAEQKYLYLYADFENYKKRVQKEREETLKFGWESAASELIPVLDNFDRALQYAKPETDPNLLMGLKMVSQQFLAALEKQGVQSIQAKGQNFDPNFHEAVAQEASDLPKDTVIREEMRGYKIHGRLLRAAKVVVSSGNAGSGNANSGTN